MPVLSPSPGIDLGFKLTDKQKVAQKMLAGPQRHTMLVGGARSSKTFLLVRCIVIRALKSPGSRHAIFRLRYNAVRASVWLDTFPTVMRKCFPQVPIINNAKDGFALFPNKSEIWFAGLDEKERVEKILGQEYSTLFFNECSQIPYSSVTTALTRLAQKVEWSRTRAYYDLNPTSTDHWTHRLFIEKVDPTTRLKLPNPQSYRHLFMSPVDNEVNLDGEYIDSLRNLPFRQRRRFFDGEYTAEVDNALWTLDIIEVNRRVPEDVPELTRIVVAVDPSGCKGEEDWRSDEIGIVVLGLGVDSHGYVLADLSGRYGPERWGSIVAQAYYQYGADAVVGEINFGGAMVQAVIQASDVTINYIEVTASRGKSIRAEPISGLYERRKVHHVGTFPLMEEQQCNFSTGGYVGEKSPDRADAMIHGLTELMLPKPPKLPGFVGGLKPGG